MSRCFKPVLCLLFSVLSVAEGAFGAAPNVVLIYADDLGYGDVGAYGAKRIPTPNMDRIAREGVRFTSGYSPSATCTPSRYAMLTGEYAWRRKGTGILPGDASLIIQPGRPTIASILKTAGYRTGIVGKWHLGLGDGHLDWNGEIKPGPMEVGFDESFIMAATQDRVPCVFIRGHRIENLDPADPISVSYSEPFAGEPTGKANPELLTMRPSREHDQTIVNGISRIGYSKGGKAAQWKDEEISDTITAEAVRFIERHQDRRFFLYFAMPEPHVPRTPHPRFVGKTELGPRGDVIVQADEAVGKVLETLDRLKLAENTLVILSSDNGPVLDDGYQDAAKEKNGDHTPAGPFSGWKYQRMEGSSRVPFVVRWPGRVKPAVSGAMISQVDLAASFAALVGQPLDQTHCPDSMNLLPALLGDSSQGRDHVVQHGFNDLAIRVGNWKYIPSAAKRTAGKVAPEALYDLGSDPAEKKNLAAAMPEKCRELAARLESIRVRAKAE